LADGPPFGLRAEQRQGRLEPVSRFGVGMGEQYRITLTVKPLLR